jgi:hypothetical protein
VPELFEQMLAESDWEVPTGGTPTIHVKQNLAATHCRWCGVELDPPEEKGTNKQFCRRKHAFYGSFTIWRARQDRREYEESQACRSSTR